MDLIYLNVGLYLEMTVRMQAHVDWQVHSTQLPQLMLVIERERLHLGLMTDDYRLKETTCPSIVMQYLPLLCL